MTSPRGCVYSSLSEKNDSNKSADWTSLQRQLGDGHINFALGHPSVLPTDFFVEAMRSGWVATEEHTKVDRSPASEVEAFLKYTSKRGSPETLLTFSNFLSEAFSDRLKGEPYSQSDSFHKVPSENLLITTGVSHGIDMACSALTRPGDVVVIELPTYFLAANIFHDHGLHLHGIPGACSNSVGGYNFDVNELRLQLERGLRPRAVYLIPSHSNPTGGTLPLLDRRKLVELSLQYGFYIFADEVYHLLHWGESPLPPRLAQVEEIIRGEAHDGLQRCRSGDIRSKIVSISSFSKILAPGLRLGWIEAAPDLIELISNRGYLSSGGCVAPFTSGLVANFISMGYLSKFIDRLKEQYKLRSTVLAEALAAQAEMTGWSYAGMPSIPTGGYFLWLRLPRDIDDCKLVIEAKIQNVSYLAGERCFPKCSLDSDSAPGADSPSAERYIRLCFAFLSVDEISDGVRRLARAVCSARLKQDTF